MSLQSICGKCKVAQLPCDLAVRVKVGDDYKIVCILPALEIKRLAATVQRQLPTGGSSSFLHSVVVVVYSSPAFPFTPLPNLPFPILLG